MPDNTPIYPPEHYDDEVRPGTDTPREQDRKGTATATPQQHMGAEEGEMIPTKPPTDELANLTDREGVQGDEFKGPNPKDEFTPG
jgi:hypothetical protein